MLVQIDFWGKEAVERAARGAINDDFRVLGMTGGDIGGASRPGRTFKDLLAVAPVCGARHSRNA